MLRRSLEATANHPGSPAWKGFDETFRAEHADPDLDRIEGTVARLEAWLVESVDARRHSPVSKLPAKLFGLLQVGLWRTLELTGAAIREMNRNNIIASHTLVRAVLETTCLLFDAVRLAQKSVDENEVASLNDVDKYLMDVLVGFKSTGQGFSEEYVARNVLTIIQRLTRELEIELMWFYEGLSERAHPNYLGMLGMYQTSPPAGEFLVQFGRPTGDRLQASMNMAIGGLAIAVEMMQVAMGQHDAIRHAFAAIAERDIYEKGYWPADVPYPVPR